MSNNLYFKDHYGGTRLLATNVEENQVFKLINKFLEAHDYKCHYIRGWTTNRNGYHGSWFDVGSHTEFFFWGVIEDDKD